MMDIDAMIEQAERMIFDPPPRSLLEWLAGLVTLAGLIGGATILALATLRYAVLFCGAC